MRIPAKEFLLASACAFFFAAPALVTPALAQSAEVKAFAALPDMAVPLISPDGQKLALECAAQGKQAVCVYDLKGQPARAFGMPPKSRLSYYFWDSSQKLLIATNSTLTPDRNKAAGGGVRFDRLAAVDVVSGGGMVPLLINPELKYNPDLTDVVTILPDDPQAVIIQAYAYEAITTRDTRLKDTSGGYKRALFKVNLSDGKGQRLAWGDENTEDYIVDRTGTVIARVDYNEKADDFAVFAIKDGKQTKVFEDKEAKRRPFNVWGAAKGGTSLAVRGYNDAGERRMFLLDLTSGAMTQSEPTPQGRDISWGIIDWQRDELVGAGYIDDLPRQSFIDPELAGVLKMLSGQFDGKGVLLQSWTPDRKMFTVEVVGFNTPSIHYLFDASAKSITEIGREREDSVLGVTTRVNYAARDGLDVQAYLTLPLGKTAADGPFPLVLLPHAGPEMRDDARYDWWASFLAARGYAVLRPNFRGSSGYGMAFRDKGYGEFGGAMVDDVIDGAKHLVAQGIADPARICAAGAGNGGYMALMTALRAPEMIKCVIAFAPVTDPSLIFQDASAAGDKSEMMQYWSDYMGDRFRDKAAMTAASPAQSAAKFQAPVLVLHGVDDTAVPIQHALLLEKRMQEAKKKMKLVQLKDDDHYLSYESSRVSLLTEMDAFLSETIGPGKP